MGAITRGDISNLSRIFLLVAWKEDKSARLPKKPGMASNRPRSFGGPILSFRESNGAVAFIPVRGLAKLYRPGETSA